MTVKITGEKEMLANFKKLPVQVARRVARGALLASAKPIIKEAKNNLAPHKRTGILRKSIKSKSAKKGRRAGDEVTILVGPTVRGFYGSFLEFGTSVFSPVRWFSRALDSTRDEQIRILQAEVGKRIIKEVRKLKK